MAEGYWQKFSAALEAITPAIELGSEQLEDLCQQAPRSTSCPLPALGQ